MKEKLTIDKLVATVCGAGCIFFKPGRVEEERCGGFGWLARVWTAGEDSRLKLLKDFYPLPRVHNDALLFETICLECAFFPADCDYRDPEVAGPKVPCGGFLAIDWLVEHNVLEPAYLVERPLVGGG